MVLVFVPPSSMLSYDFLSAAANHRNCNVRADEFWETFSGYDWATSENEKKTNKYSAYIDNSPLAVDSKYRHYSTISNPSN